MSKIVIVTDSNSGITQEQADKLGVFVIPMPVVVGDEIYYEGIDIDRKQFYEKLLENINISTSQPSPADIMKLWSDLLTNYDAIVYIPMSSSLSGSYQTSVMLSNEFDGKFHVVNNQRISVSQRQSVLDALEMISLGMPALKIKETLEKDKYNSSIYIAVETLEYLKKGGRINPTAATLGCLLKIKPILQIQGEKLESFAKARTINSAKKTMINAIKNDIFNRFGGNNKGNKILLQIAHTNRDKEAKILRKELQIAFPEYPIYVDHLPLSISCHLGSGVLGVGCIKKIKYK
ncbi:DegV family protein [Tissierella creatinophila]|uniref:DegV domain-containing protein n=1 Tax=Tissierella creatinophila DSM 6911 TaxID=1123403 RepID=A0A1U7M3V0_TISCR|nr:DegV family protein [Tissierella creatinophila]OLS01920.1 DegV domain-containing protein [Tissierella creatinophila DSM 6911]